MVSSKISVVTAALYRSFNTDYSTSALEQLKQGKLPDFPPIGDDTSCFSVDYQAYNFCRKVRDPILGFVPPAEAQLVEEAVSSFLEVEAICDIVNKVGYLPHAVFSGNSAAYEAVTFTALRKIDSLLKEFDLDEFASSIDFSNGASTRLPRRRAAVPHKFAGKPHVTRECAFLAMNLIWYHEPWRAYCQLRYGRESDPCTWVSVVKGSEYFTVPKTATKLRGACKEPELNMLCQKAIGSMIRKRLRNVSIDLNDQTRNQSLAREGSITGSLATIDLSSASDSVSLVMLRLLPESWRRMLEMTRSQHVQLPNGTWHELAKVSSMGNGFTFELESLLFWAFAQACVDHVQPTDRRVGIYGDDIIVATECADLLIGVLDYHGFSTNKDKTFVSGPFRESCGGHYHRGVDVTPFYLRTACESLEDKFHFLNSLNGWVYKHGSVDKKTHAYAHNVLLPKEDRVFVPPHAGTKAGLFLPTLSMHPNLVYCQKRQMYGYRMWCATSRSRRVPTMPGYLTYLLRAQLGKVGEVLVVEDGEGRHRFKYGFSSKWDDSDVILPKCLLI